MGGGGGGGLIEPAPVPRSRAGCPAQEGLRHQKWHVALRVLAARGAENSCQRNRAGFFSLTNKGEALVKLLG